MCVKENKKKGGGTKTNKGGGEEEEGEKKSLSTCCPCFEAEYGVPIFSQKLDLWCEGVCKVQILVKTELRVYQLNRDMQILANKTITTQLTILIV